MFALHRSAAIATPLLFILTLVAAAGPPWISIEYPANPHDAETRGALVVVHTYHHETAIGSTLRAEALGRVDGHSTTVPLQVTRTSRPGVFAIRGDLPHSSAWVLSVTRANHSGEARATALVAMNGERELLAVRVPHGTAENGRWMVPRDPTEAEVEALLQTAFAMSDAARASNAALGAGAAALVLLLIPSGAWLARRRQRELIAQRD